eukprot:scaffold635_cov53-Phaeocystis_antarctica.AAC.4
MTEYNPAPSPSGCHPLLSGPPTLTDIHQIFTLHRPPSYPSRLEYHRNRDAQALPAAMGARKRYATKTKRRSGSANCTNEHAKKEKGAVLFNASRSNVASRREEGSPYSP